MTYQALVVNGCSYMYAYADGQGHHDLAKRLNIPAASSLAVSGCSNGRILRSTLKHSYSTTQPTFYVLGMTFMSRDELPVLRTADHFEGAWTNPQNQDHKTLWQPQWTQSDTEAYRELKLKWEWNSHVDRGEDLQYRMLSVINDLQSRGHAVMMFNQADDLLEPFFNDPRLGFFCSVTNIIHGYRWQAIPYQHEKAVPCMDYGELAVADVPERIKHRRPGSHEILNQFLADYTVQHKLLR